MIFRKINAITGNPTNTNIDYWLASSYVEADFCGNQAGYEGYGAVFGMRYVFMIGRVDTAIMVFSFGGSTEEAHCVRPVVILNPNVQFGIKTNGVWSISAN